VVTDAGGVTLDASVAGADAAVFTLPLTAVPTAVTLSDTGTLLSVASDGVNGMHLNNRPVPLTGAAGTPVDLSAGGAPCVIDRMVVRGSNVFTACVTPAPAPRVFNVSTGAQVGQVSVPISAAPVMVDHEKMVAVASAASTGGTGWPDPVTGGVVEVQLGNADNSINTGAGLIEGANGVIEGMISSTITPGYVGYWVFTGTSFTSGTGLPVSVTPELITSGRPVAGANPALQPVLLLSGSTQAAALYDGQALKAAANGAQLNTVKSFSNLSLPSGTAMRVKISQDSLFAYYLDSANTRLCRLALTGASTAQDCRTLTAGCNPVDFAPHVRTGPTVVACRGNGGFLEVQPAF
jgi:hypothetical protein